MIISTFDSAAIYLSRGKMGHQVETAVWSFDQLFDVSVCRYFDSLLFLLLLRCTVNAPHIRTEHCVRIQVNEVWKRRAGLGRQRQPSLREIG